MITTIIKLNTCVSKAIIQPIHCLLNFLGIHCHEGCTGGLGRFGKVSGDHRTTNLTDFGHRLTSEEMNQCLPFERLVGLAKTKALKMHDVGSL